MQKLQFDDFPLKTFDKIRYADTDAQGHVNNAVFSTYLETGRVEFLYNPEYPILADDSSYVIVSLDLNYHKEVTWPGKVEIGTGILKIGNSSIKIYQQLFKNDIQVAVAETVIVQVDDKTGKSKPLTDTAKQSLGKWLLDVNK